MLSGPLIALNSSASTKLGCATYPASISPGFRYLTTYLAPKLLYRRFYDGIDSFIAVVLLPLHEVEVRRAVQLKRVAVEDIGHYDVVAIGRELIRNELSIDELVADDIGQDEYSVGYRLVLWICNVCLSFNGGMLIALVSCLSNTHA